MINPFSYLWYNYLPIFILPTIWLVLWLGLYASFTLISRSVDSPVFWKRRETRTDLFYYYLQPVLYVPFNKYLLIFLFSATYSYSTIKEINHHGFAPMNQLPIWVQVILFLFLSDFIGYWIHRVSHLLPRLWRFHTIHHSTQDMNWMSAIRWHPINYIFQHSHIYAFTLVGFSPGVFETALFIYGLNGTAVHANLNWTYGPLRYIVVSPVFHRWHHTSLEEGGNKNFSSIFSVIDLVFGTFYLPKEQVQPQKFGVYGDTIPENFFQQLIYPFKSNKPAPLPTTQTATEVKA